MERLRVGDVFHARGSSHEPYTVTAVLNDGYVVQQKGDDTEQYDIKTIHNLFTAERSWELHRKPLPLFNDKNADLFAI